MDVISVTGIALMLCATHTRPARCSTRLQAHANSHAEERQALAPTHCSHRFFVSPVYTCTQDSILTLNNPCYCDAREPLSVQFGAVHVANLIHVLSRHSATANTSSQKSFDTFQMHCEAYRTYRAHTGPFKQNLDRNQTSTTCWQKSIDSYVFNKGQS